MESVNLITSHNRRLAHVRRFTCNPPARGVELRLVTCEDPPQALGSWTREECDANGSTAELVDATLQDHAQTLQEEVTATLAWTAKDGSIVISKRLRCRYAPDEASGDPQDAVRSEALGITGTQAGTLLQTQRAMEASLRMYISAHQTQIGTMQALVHELFTQQRELLALHHRTNLELDNQRHKQRAQLDALYDRLLDAETANDSGDPEKDAKAALIEQISEPLAKALPLLIGAAVQQFMAPKQASAPAVATPEPQKKAS